MAKTPTHTPNPITQVSSHEIKQLEKLLASDGWGILKRLLQDDLLQAALALSSPQTNPTPDNIHYRRGAMYATTQLINAPDLMIQKLRNDLIISQSIALSKPQRTEP